MTIIVAAPNKSRFIDWVKTNFPIANINKFNGEAIIGNNVIYYAGHDPERLRGLRAEAFVVIGKVSSCMLDQLQMCCVK